MSAKYVNPCAVRWI